MVFGTTVSGRPDDLPGADAWSGLFINTLPLRVRLAPAEPVATWLRALQRRNAAMREHEHTPLVRAQTMSGIPRGDALFDTLLVFESYPVDADLGPAAEDLGVGAVAALERTNYPVTFEVAPGERLLLQLDHDLRAVGASAARELLRRVARALEVLAAAGAQARLGDLSLLDAGERRALEAWNQTQVAVPRASVHELFAAQAARSPGALAVVDRARSLTYGELDRRANQLAWRLLEAGVGPEAIVAIAVERSLEMLIGLVAILKAGAAYLPLDPAYPAERIAYMLDDARPSVVLASAAQREATWASVANVWNLDGVLEELGDRAAAEPPPVRTAPGQLAYCIYTSGSTGKPKGVAVEHASLVNFLGSMAEHLDVQRR